MKAVILAEDFLLEKIAQKLIWGVSIDRANSINKVFGTMLEKHKNNRVIGLIDDDKKVEAPYKSLFTHVVAEEHHLIIRRSELYPFHSVIIVKPPADKWLWQASESVGVQAAVFGLGTNLQEFIGFTKGERNSRNPNLAEFIGAVARAKPLLFTNLQKWMRNELTRTA